MSSGSSNLGGKSLSATAPSFTSNSPTASGPPPSFESSSRRPAQSNSSSSSAPRKGQASRKQHRNQRRPGPQRLADRVDEADTMDELRAIQKASSRRGQTSITHLLNYSVPSRQYYDSHPRSSRRHPTWGPGSGHHAIDKARFVHANYRFVVSPTGTYTAHAADADKHIEWSDVLQIIASAESQSTSCPICLSEPVAPRMARCGHIFCFPCLLRFMNSTNDDEPSARREARWKKCPICEDSFKLADTKPVRFYHGQESPLPRPGEDVVLRLMVRDAGSTLALPKEGGMDVVNLDEDVPWHFAVNVMDYARIIKGTESYVTEQYDREIQELQIQAHDDEIQFGIEDADWGQRAIRAIRTVRDKGQEMSAENREKAAATPGSKGKQASGGQQFHFYTAPPHLYLSPLDIRILKTKFGDFSNFPTTLLPCVEHISTGHVVDDALRKRAKYLGHLPQGCIVSFLECDWTDIVPEEILKTFAPDLERRRKAHRDKTAQEDRERLQSERLEAAAIGRGTRRHFEQTHGEDFTLEAPPAINSDDFQPLGAVTGTTPPNPRPGFEHLAEMSTSPSASKTVWGTRVVAASSPDMDPAYDRDANDGWLKPDDYLEAADMARQMEALNMEGAGPSGSGGGSTPNANSGGGGGGGGKKKKKQKITLMSTGGHRFG